MKPVIKASIATIAATLFLGAAGCSSGNSPEDGDQAQGNALSKLDPCKIMTPEKAAKAGLPPQGKPRTAVESQPACAYFGDSATIGVIRIADDSFDEYGKRSTWSDFKRLKVNGRDGAEAHVPGEPEGDCITAMSAGGGVVAIQAQAADPRKPFDGRAESLKIAKLIEPDLPK